MLKSYRTFEFINLLGLFVIGQGVLFNNLMKYKVKRKNN